jgi:hypothetical protein
MSTNFPSHHLASEASLLPLQARPITELIQIDEDGRTPLHWAAAAKGGQECLEYILNNIKDQFVDLPDESSWTPLMNAASVGNAISCGRMIFDCS